MNANLKISPMEDRRVFDQLVQEYEQEFAPITGKKPGEDGLYALDSEPVDPYQGFYLLDSDQVIGFAIKGVLEGRHDIAEFYIVPERRRTGCATWFAQEIFRWFRGEWQVRQIEGATEARAFWRSCINRFTKGDYLEEQVADPDWGPVTRQRFSSEPTTNVRST